MQEFLPELPIEAVIKNKLYVLLSQAQAINAGHLQANVAQAEEIVNSINAIFSLCLGPEKSSKLQLKVSVYKNVPLVIFPQS